MRLRPRAAALAALCLLAGGALFAWAKGPLRGFGGDVLVVVFLVACVAAVGLGTPRSRALGVLAFAVSVECVQGLGLVDRGSHWLWHLTLGSTFDPWDLLAYAIGAGLAWTAGERVEGG
jgi:hypothetical protein